MCGIVAAVADRNIVPQLLEGLRKLEYRGYDSAGIAVEQDGRLAVVHRKGKVSGLAETVGSLGLAGTCGIGRLAGLRLGLVEVGPVQQHATARPWTAATLICGVISGITMVFVPSVSTFVISQMLGSGKNLLVGDLIDLQFMGGAYNPHLGSAIALVMIILIFICICVFFICFNNMIYF